MSEPQYDMEDVGMMAQYDSLRREIRRLTALNAELLAAADAARLCLKSRDQDPLEMKVLDALRVAIAKARF